MYFREIHKKILIFIIPKKKKFKYLCNMYYTYFKPKKKYATILNKNIKIYLFIYLFIDYLFIYLIIYLLIYFFILIIINIIFFLPV